jgi:hypothetical protein
MVQAIRSFFAVVASHTWAHSRAKAEEIHMVGAYPVDYSEPSQAEIDAASNSCADVFKTGNWVPVNRKS